MEISEHAEEIAIFQATDHDHTRGLPMGMSAEAKGKVVKRMELGPEKRQIKRSLAHNAVYVTDHQLTNHMQYLKRKKFA